MMTQPDDDDDDFIEIGPSGDDPSEGEYDGGENEGEATTYESDGGQTDASSDFNAY